MSAYASQFDGSTSYETKFNEIFYLHGHRHIYSKNGIKDVLTSAGFTALKESSFRDLASRYGSFDTHALRFAISDRATTQYWDAAKGK